jgi:hypothetical protein
VEVAGLPVQSIITQIASSYSGEVEDISIRTLIVLSRVRGSVTKNNGFWIGWSDLLALLLQVQSIITDHNHWVLKTRSIPCWTTSVFSSAVTDLVLIYESVTSSASVVRWLTLHSWTLNSLTNEPRLNYDSLATELSWTELTSRRTEYKSPSPTVRVLLCFIHCHGNVYLASCWLAMDFRICSLQRERVLPKRCLEIVIFVTVYRCLPITALTCFTRNKHSRWNF